MKYLIRQWIEALHDNAQCPRLMVDATAQGVDVPDRVKAQWGEAMPIDLDPSFPLELSLEGDGVDCVLSFGGPHACHFPWGSIYVVQDRESQIGMVLEENLPARLAQSLATGSKSSNEDAPTVGETPRLRLAVSGPAEDAAPLEPASARRPRFKVIDGGK